MTEAHNDRSAASEQEYLEDNIATVAYHLGQPGAFISVHYDGGPKLLVDPGEVLQEVSRRLTGTAAQPEQLKLEWRDGPPPKPWSEEWFIAETTFGDRVCLTSLPEEWTYDFKTADDTYIKADKIKRWMQFPDSSFIAPAAQPPAAPVDAERLIAKLDACLVPSNIIDEVRSAIGLPAAPVETNAASIQRRDRIQGALDAGAPVEVPPTRSSIETCRECGVSDPCGEDCPNYIEPKAHPQSSAGAPVETADFETVLRQALDDITVEDGKCNWADVANILPHVRGELRARTPHPHLSADSDWAKRQGIVCQYPDGADRCAGCSHYQDPKRNPVCTYATSGPQAAPVLPEADYVKTVCKHLRSSHPYSGITEPNDVAAADLIEALYLAALPSLSRPERASESASGASTPDQSRHAIAWTTSGDNEEANAAFIVKAVNNHEMLVNALERIAAIEDKYEGSDWEEIEEAREIAGAALASVVGGARE